MAEIDSMCTEPGLRQVSITFSPDEVDQILSVDFFVLDDTPAETVRLYALLQAAQAAFNAPGRGR